MGAKSTLYISRADALEYVNKRMDNQLTDKKLEELMEELYGDNLLYNYIVVDDYEDRGVNEYNSFDNARWSHDLEVIK